MPWQDTLRLTISGSVEPCAPCMPWVTCRLFPLRYARMVCRSPTHQHWAAQSGSSPHAWTPLLKDRTHVNRGEVADTGWDALFRHNMPCDHAWTTSHHRRHGPVGLCLCGCAPSPRVSKVGRLTRQACSTQVASNLPVCVRARTAEGCSATARARVGPPPHTAQAGELLWDRRPTVRTPKPSTVAFHPPCPVNDTHGSALAWVVVTTGNPRRATDRLTLVEQETWSLVPAAPVSLRLFGSSQRLSQVVRPPLRWRATAPQRMHRHVPWNASCSLLWRSHQHQHHALHTHLPL